VRSFDCASLALGFAQDDISGAARVSKPSCPPASALTDFFKTADGADG
jgi:hypothetical protein